MRQGSEQSHEAFLGQLLEACACCIPTLTFKVSDSAVIKFAKKLTKHMRVRRIHGHAASICSGAAPAEDAANPIWPTKEWQTSTPEEQGMDSKELAQLVDFGTTHGFDSLLVVRHGKIVAEAYYAPYVAGIPHTMNSVTKAVIGTLTAIASKDGLLDSPSHRALDFFDRRNIANVED